MKMFALELDCQKTSRGKVMIEALLERAGKWEGG
jgi:hypothetical protein